MDVANQISLEANKLARHALGATPPGVVALFSEDDPKDAA